MSLSRTTMFMGSGTWMSGSPPMAFFGSERSRRLNSGSGALERDNQDEKATAAHLGREGVARQDKVRGGQAGRDEGEGEPGAPLHDIPGNTEASIDGCHRGPPWPALRTKEPGRRVHGDTDDDPGKRPFCRILMLRYPEGAVCSDELTPDLASASRASRWRPPRRRRILRPWPWCSWIFRSL